MFKLELSEQQLRVISAALEKEAYKDVAQVIHVINEQLAKQNNGETK